MKFKDLKMGDFFQEDPGGFGFVFQRTCDIHVSDTGYYNAFLVFGSMTDSSRGAPFRFGDDSDVTKVEVKHEVKNEKR